jgi:hypothetical protein
MLALFAGSGSVAAAESRTWKDSSGKFELVAELVEVNDGKVSLKKQDGSVVEIDISRLSSEDRQFLKNRGAGSSSAGSQDISASQLTGKQQEIANDDGNAAGKKSFPRGIAALFESESDDLYLTSIKIHGARYGTSRAPEESFSVTLCDKDFKSLAEYKFPYSRFARGDSKWVTLRLKPTKLPKDFVLCLNFNPTGTKGVYVSHDAEGKSLVGLPGKPAGSFTGGDWMIRAVTDKLK